MARPLSRPSRGFTLIELLVVISIIGLMSSVILAALSGARTKGKEGVIVQDLEQLRNLYETVYATYGNYSSLQPQSLPGTLCGYYDGVSAGYKCTALSSAGCSSIYASDMNNASALSLCNQIVSMTGNLSVGLATANNRQYSIWAWLPSQQIYKCYGSTGNTSSTSSSPTSAPGNLSPGCPSNP